MSNAGEGVVSNPYQELIDQQKRSFLSNVTKSATWRLDQLDRMERMLLENEARWTQALYEDFRKPDFERKMEIVVPTGNITYYRENLEELMAPEAAELPAGLAALGLLLLLDQYPRHAFRGQAAMYATDRLAVEVAERLSRQGIGLLPEDLLLFAILPFAHSELLADQERSVALHRRYLPEGLHRAERHRNIITRFGRFPHRNRILGRSGRAEEIQYLKTGGFQG